MVDLGAYIFKDLNIREIKPEESFIDTFVEEVYEPEHVHNTKKLLLVILDAKYKKANLHKVMETQCQHLTMTQHNDLLKSLQRFEELFNGRLGNWKTDPVEFKLEQDLNPVCSQKYPVPKLHE